ncbi:Mitochondrial import inner membrane translocase subunit TIM50 [Phytophthora boehmeriae]|uniref:Mitochondrial import inner membrane translocase subunit TIM50 n=1 Tax=Phytophthora boehmeriae TaxID=109152 RepID=A0A8T1X7L9_9STRA|nr:Mitochondrial import inner membrane translocase subunit TIM50 [Phytophthora boehmeriae]
MNVNANTIATLLGPGASSKAQIGQVQVGKYPAVRSRRPRETIELELTEEQQRTLSSDEIRKLKNRVAAKRARVRSQQRIADMENTVRELWKRVQYLERVIQLLHPNEPMDYLYSKYVMYADSPSLEPLVDGDSGKNNLTPLDMNELEWLLHGSPQDSNDFDMDG